MNLWKSLKKWMVRDIDIANEEEAQAQHSMVGEPVISFIESLNRERNRRYEFAHIDRIDYTGQVFDWMGFSDFYQMTDRKTGNVFQALLLENRLYSVHGLPFDLNGWELEAIFRAILSYRQDAIRRRARIRHNRSIRDYQAKQKQETIAREQYAKQFRENCE